MFLHGRVRHRALGASQTIDPEVHRGGASHQLIAGSEDSPRAVHAAAAHKSVQMRTASLGVAAEGCRVFVS